MRVSEKLRFDAADSRIERARAENLGLMEKIATQKRVNRISDDPRAIPKIFRMREHIKDLDLYEKNIHYAKAYVNRSETALSAIHNNLIRAKELAVAMSNDTYASDSREATAREVKELMNGLISLANSQYAGRYVFSGFRTQTPPLSGDGKYLGDDGEIFLQINGKDFQKINLTGRNLFEATAQEREGGHFGMVDTLDLLYRGLIADDVDQIRKAMGELDYQMDKSSSYQANLGAMSSALDGALSRIGVDDELTQSQLSGAQDADLYKASSDFKKSEGILQSTLLASNKMLQPSLLNFLQ